jgi:hypothetical protein
MAERPSKDGTVSSQPTAFPLLTLARQLSDFGARVVLVKHLAPNDNGKNQIYVGGDMSSIGLLPAGELKFRDQKPNRGPIFGADLKLCWLNADGQLEPAPDAKIISYPQYPESRLSGFVRGCRAAPASLFDHSKEGRSKGRVLLLAPLDDGRVIAVAYGGETVEAAALAAATGESYGVFQLFPLRQQPVDDARHTLLMELARIHRLGWVPPMRLMKDGSTRPCVGRNCAGVTLETLLGIAPNGYAEPDFHGWEVKQHGVGSLLKPRSGRVTLMTPEPDGGVYAAEGAEYFVRRWGYRDRNGHEDRINFGGEYSVKKDASPLTGLRLAMHGFDVEREAIDGAGQIALLTGKDEVAASWSFTKLMNHWRRKHARAVYVPSEKSNEAGVRYRYGNQLLLGEGTSFSLLLRAISGGAVRYDPGLKIEDASTSFPKGKWRSQFRAPYGQVPALYQLARTIDLHRRDGL